MSPALRRRDLLDEREFETGLELIYRFLLARSVDEAGREHYLQMHNEGMKLREVAAEIGGSDEFQSRLRRSLPESDVAAPAAASPADGFVDVRQLSNNFSVAELGRAAEQYYRSTVEFADRYLAKPLDNPHDAPELLGSFAHLLGGLRLTPGMTVLDFGAGTCWTTRFLTQLGCAVIAVDVSETALQLGRTLFSRLPPIGNQPAPQFLVFDGHRIDLPDASVDRIACFDAFHHVPNPAEVLREFGRLLRPGGIAGFSEPGPHHSKAARSQYEMKNYTAFENDVVMNDIWRWAQAAGFSDVELAVFSTESTLVSLSEFDDLLAGGGTLDAYAQKLRDFLLAHQTFFLRRSGHALRDSRDREGLRAEITIHLERSEVTSLDPIRGTAMVQNVGTSVWLPGATPVGGVNLGVHLRSQHSQPVNVDFARVLLDRRTRPGEERTIEFSFQAPPPGDYVLEFDLVSEGIGWFEMNGSPTVTVRVAVTAG